MLTESSLLGLFDSLGTPTAGRKLVMKARREAPVRKVKCSGSNVITHAFSRKMEDHIGLESKSVEYVAARWYERSNEVLEYHAQPVELDLILKNQKSGRPYRLQHFPDFLLLTPDGIFLDEWREEDRLRKLLVKRPGRYVQDERGWSFPALEDHLAEVGIRYRLRSSAGLPRQFVQNAIFLANYLDDDYPTLDQTTVTTIRDVMADLAVVPLTDFIDRSKGLNAGFSMDEVYKAIADGLLVVDQERESISDTERVRVFRDTVSMTFHRRIEGRPNEALITRKDVSISVGSKVDYDGIPYEVTFRGQGKLLLTGGDGHPEIPMDLVHQLQADGRLLIRNQETVTSENGLLVPTPGPQKLERILQRMELVELAKEQRVMAGITDRTLRRYRRAILDAGPGLYDQHLALADHYERSGNRNRKIPEELIECIKFVVVNIYNKPTCPNKRAAYRAFLIECHTRGLQSCSERTFLKELSRHKSTLKRKGSRLDYQEQPIIDYLRHSEPVHGERPFEFVHIDHTPLEILGRSPEERDSLGGVWLSLALDAATRVVLGYYITYEKPSYRSVMMVLRDIVRRHGRMPDMIIVDNGPDFKSGHLKRLCKTYGSSIRFRPKAKPRYGGVLERLFGTLHTQLIHQMNGNTQIHKHHRSMTKAVRPGNFVEWTLFALHGAFGGFFENLYGTENHPALGEPPLEYFRRRLFETGARYQRRVAFNREFLIETCPGPKDKQPRVVDGIRGVKVDHIWYWWDGLSAPEWHGRAVEVKTDPWDPGVVFVLVKDTWQECNSKWRGLLRNLTAVELRYSTEALLKKHGVKKKDLTPERMAEWIKVFDVQRLDPRIAAQQAEAKYLYEQLGMTAVNQNPSSSVLLEAVEGFQTPTDKAPRLQKGQHNTEQMKTTRSSKEERGRMATRAMEPHTTEALPPQEESYDLL